MNNVVSSIKFPELPAPLLSDTPGESYEWGDYYLTFQHNPPFMFDYVKSLADNKELIRSDVPLRYLYVMSVFYKKGKNPSGIDSNLPCEILTLEQIKDETGTGRWLKPSLCLFTDKFHLNISEFEFEITEENVKREFFKILSSKISGEPVKIGTIQDLIDLKTGKKKTSWISYLIISIICGFFGYLYLGALIACLESQIEDTFSLVCAVIGSLFLIPPIILLPKIFYGVFSDVFRGFLVLFHAISNFFSVLKNTTNLQKYFIGLTLVSVAMLLLALPDRWIDAGGYFVFLRIVCFASLIGLLLEKLPVWLKFPILLLAILYNPVFQIHLRDRDVWRFFNVISIFFLLIPWCVVMKRLYIKSKNSLQNDSQTGLQNGTSETR